MAEDESDGNEDNDKSSKRMKNNSKGVRIKDQDDEESDEQ